MALIKYKLGDLIIETNRRNENGEYGLEYVRGISNSKQIMPTKAETDEDTCRKFYIVLPDEFVYNPRTTRMGDKLGLAYNDTDTPLLFSFNNIAFAIKESAKNILLPRYLFMFFNRSEFDRYAMVNGWGSATELFSFSELCDVDIELPSVGVQQRYVDIYNSMLINQQCYEQGINDLRLICDCHFDISKKEKSIPLGEIIEKVDERNSDGIYLENDVRGITNKKQFDATKANLDETDLTKFKIVHHNEFAYNSRTDGRDMLVLALNRDDENLIVTFNYNVFKIKESMTDKVNSEYLYSYFMRSEFDRRVRFGSWGSSQELLSWDNLCEITVPIPDIDVQNSIAKINIAYMNRKEINEQLKLQLKGICPVLIKGSLEDARCS